MQNIENRKKKLIMMALMLVLFFQTFNSTLIAAATPKIIAAIGGFEHLEWIFTIRMFVVTITLLLAGSLSDQFGRRRLLLIGVIIFTIGTFLCGHATGLFQFVLFRIIQAVGSGILTSTYLTTIGDLFNPRERGFWQGLMLGILGITGLFGPLLGGYIVDHYSWQWTFWLFSPFGMIAFVVIQKAYPKWENKHKHKAIDYVGALLLSLFLFLLLLIFTLGKSTYAWSSLQMTVLTLVAFVILFLFIKWENQLSFPILPLYLFKNRNFIVANLTGVLLTVGMAGALIYSPFYIQGVLGLSAIQTGIVMMYATLAMALSGLMSGFLLSKSLNFKIMALIGISFMAIGMYLHATLTPSSSYTYITILMILIGFGIGMNYPVLTIAIQNSVEQRYLGVATATMQTFRSLGSTIGVAIFGIVMSISLNNQPAVSYPELSDPQILLKKDQLESIRNSLSIQQVNAFDTQINSLKITFNDALSNVFGLGFILILMALLCVFLLQQMPIDSRSGKHEA
ncbi:DHA2 family efflux MFS transporter permease subunit [Hazenella sp. IB182353]|uniref:DHA2 family efflux MFS transporter permease subunit n=1 Tax=Polycladospora coralii TaxID=2771432 RepID=UPI001747D3AE|nr:DHA2 family efflux MFS transporter permease subunit [Polycladospora coralii]MBS7529009.1 DHA2 family efflux MFS transporter permease subunit [Polycladospora coralii]